MDQAKWFWVAKCEVWEVDGMKTKLYNTMIGFQKLEKALEEKERLEMLQKDSPTKEEYVIVNCFQAEVPGATITPCCNSEE